MNNEKRTRNFRLYAGVCLITLLIILIDIRPFCIVSAADHVSTIEAGSILPEEYGCSFQISDETRTETFGVDNALRDSIDPGGTRAIEVQEITDSSQKGETGILYTNVGVYRGEVFDLKVTLTDWGKVDKKIKPNVCFYTDNLRIGLNAVERAKFSFEFFGHGTEEPMKIKGHFTMREENTEYSVTMLFDSGFSVELESDSAKAADFTFTPYDDGISEISTKFHQRVGASGVSWEEAVKTGEKKPYEFCEYETFEYQFRHRLSPNHMKEYEMRSVLDKCLAVYGKEDIRVTDGLGKNVTARFQIAIDGQTIICRAKENELDKKGFTNGEIYTFHLEVHRKRGVEIEEEHFHQASDGFTFQIPGTAQLSWMTADGDKNSITSETAWVQSRMLAELTVEHTADYEWKPGDIGDFTVLVRQTNVNARAINVQVENLALPQGLQLIGNASASGAPGVKLQSNERGWKLSCPELDFGHVIAVVFQCRADEDIAGQELLNTVTATADNYLDVSGNVDKAARDSQDIWVNAAAVTTQSRLDRETWKEGDEIICRLTVLNTQEHTVAVDTEISDEILPEGLKLTSVDEIAPDRTFDMVMYPISDKRTGMLRKAKNNYWNIFTEENSWRLNIDYLAYQVPLQIELRCIAEADSAENAPESDERALLILKYKIHNRNLKENDNRLNNEYRVGEIVDYQITVENRNPGTAAENLIISNVSLPEGLQLHGGVEAVVWEGAKGTVTTEGTGWKMNIESLPYNTPVTVKYACVVSESVNGMEVINTAAASAENGQEVKGSTKIWVNSPELQISHKPDKDSCKYGDTIAYQVRLSQTETGCVSRNAVFEVLGAEGMKLRKKSIKVLDSLDREISCDVRVTGNNFIIHTGKNLIKDDYYTVLNAAQDETVQQSLWNPLGAMESTELIVKYQVTVTDAALAEREAASHITVNSDENIPKENEEILQVKTPVIKLEKKSDKQTYTVGDSAFYTLTVTQMGEDTEASDITVIDKFYSDKMTIVGDSLQIRLNGIVINAENIEVEQNRFIIHTGKNLKEGERMEISYQAVFDNPKLEGTTLVNRAEVNSSETEVVSTEHEVYIGEKIADIQEKNREEQEDVASNIPVDPSKMGEDEIKVPIKDKNTASETADSSKAALFLIIITGAVLNTAGLLTRLHFARKVHSGSIRNTRHNKYDVTGKCDTE